MRQALSKLPQQLHQYYRFSTLESVLANFFHGQWKSRSPEDQQGYILISRGIE